MTHGQELADIIIELAYCPLYWYLVDTIHCMVSRIAFTFTLHLIFIHYAIEIRGLGRCVQMEGYHRGYHTSYSLIPADKYAAITSRSLALAPGPVFRPV